VRQPPSERGD